MTNSLRHFGKWRGRNVLAALLVLLTAYPAWHVGQAVARRMGQSIEELLASSPQTGVVFSPGYRVRVGEKVVAIWGDDSCEEAFSDRPAKLSCIDIGNKASVTVHFAGDAGHVMTETWRVERSKNNSQVALRTPSGTLVTD